jgi:hypothetical protein
MSKQTLTIEGITFPKFSKGSSKRNFRLIFYIAYKGEDGKNKTVIVTKPSGGAWQWKKSDKDFFLPEADDLGNSVELDVSPLRFGSNGFSANDFQIAEIDGKLSMVAVQFVDVHDGSIFDFFKEKILPQVIEELKKIGFNPIDLLPVPGVVTGVIKSKVKIEDLAKKVEDFLIKAGKDKLLHSVNAKYKKGNSFTISGEKEWEKGKIGTYGVTIGFE